MSGDVGQFAAHVVKLKVLSPEGRKFEVSEKTAAINQPIKELVNRFFSAS